MKNGRAKRKREVRKKEDKMDKKEENGMNGETKGERNGKFFKMIGTIYIPGFK